MEWLFIWGLCVWLLVLGSRIRAAERRISELEARPRQEAHPPTPSEAPHEPAPVPSGPAPTSPVPAPPPRPPVEVGPATIPSPQPARATPRPAIAKPTGRTISDWLAENGLAWMGGGALALGGLFLVVYAAEHGFFTPFLRILAAVLVGALMLAASEWIRRRKDAPGRHLLAAALLAGAGAATVYGAIWAAHGLYAFISLPVAAALMAGVSFSLLALSLLHGQPLAVLAILGGVTAPAVTGPDAWNAVALDGYLLALTATGYAACGLRRWGWAGAATLLGASLWSVQGIVRDHHIQAGLLVTLFVIGAGACARLGRKGAPSEGGPEPDGLFRLQPDMALWAGGVILVLAWAGFGVTTKPLEPVVALSAMLAFLGAAIASEGLARPALYAAPVAAPALGLAVAYHVEGRALTSFQDAVLLLVPAMVMAGSGLGFGIRSRSNRTLLVGAGAIGAAAIATLAWPVLRRAAIEPSWAPPMAAAVLMSLGAVLLARRVEDRAADPGLGLWIAGTVALWFLTIHAGVDHHAAPVVHALAALALAALALRLGWRGLAEASAVGGLVAFAAMIRPAFVGDVLSGKLGWPLLAAVTVLAAGALGAGGRLLRRRSPATETPEALNTWALLVFFLGAFLLLHVWVGGGAGRESLGLLIEGGLRTDVLLSMGLLLAIRAREGDGRVARWRLLGTLMAGVLHGVFWQILVFNPWLGLGEEPLGPPLFDTLALTYLAPAVLLALAAHKGVRGPLVWSRLAAVFAFVFGLAWVILEVRHAFHPRGLSAGPVGRIEACGYVLAGLLTASGLHWVRARRSLGQATKVAYLAAAAPLYGLVALTAAALVFCWFASPWWGPRTEPFASTGEAILLFATYLLGVGATAWLRRPPPPEGWSWFSPGALTVVVAELFVLATLIVRWSFHGADMSRSLPHESVETWTFSAVWAVFGLVTLIFGGLKGSLTLRWLGLVILVGTLAKVIVFDMENLNGAIRAASFLAVGALLIFGALAARRLNAGADARKPLPGAGPPAA